MIFKKENNDYYIKIAALLIHAAKIDEDYSSEEQEIIKKTLVELGLNNEDLEIFMIKAKKMEENSNQILEFTREVKNLAESDKIKIIKSLWRIIYSNNNADIYETNLMRRLSGLLYIDSKTMGDIKKDIIKENS
ncbi:TerB family tellurite resistance protein [Candidatus Pelagibacter communis]|uniref:tellurite resistance TerB family protein n=1 Tax=Pelagibacter ubique TaxID=198252 RepID=UPI00094D9995|nr:TerB family tellurite resistance protein [Candidatus Pelagibacter ubique]|tara:strand:+ start:1201 stop:1602 length:402 start_codon:yes stop_codon:yes gene_type:complete